MWYLLARVHLDHGPVSPHGQRPLPCKTSLFRHSYEVRDCANLHFFHYRAAVELDRFFDRSKVVGNLLVEPTRNDVCEHLALAGGQARYLSLNRSKVRVSLTRLDVLLDGSRNRRQQIVVADRFGEEIDGTRLHGAHARRNVALSSNENDRSLRAPGCQRLLQLEAIETRHRYVQDGAARDRRVVVGQEILRRNIRLDIVALKSHEAFQ